MPFYTAILKVRPVVPVTRVIIPLGTHTATTAATPPTTTTRRPEDDDGSMYAPPLPTPTTRNPDGTPTPIEAVTANFLSHLKAGGALVRSVRYNGFRPLPIAIRSRGIQHFYADFATVEFACKPNLIPDVQHKCKTEVNLLRLSILNADDVLKQCIKQEAS